MAFTPTPPAAAPAPVAPAPAPAPKTLANQSAAGTTEGAPTPLSVGPAPGSGMPGAASAPAPQAPKPGAPPAGQAAPVRSPVAPHAGKESVGTHQTANTAAVAKPVGQPVHGGFK